MMYSSYLRVRDIEYNDDVSNEKEHYDNNFIHIESHLTKVINKSCLKELIHKVRKTLNLTSLHFPDNCSNIGVLGDITTLKVAIMVQNKKNLLNIVYFAHQFLLFYVITHLRVRQQPAHKIAERPVGPDTDVGQRWRGDGEQQIGYGEIEQEAVGDGAHLPVPEHGPGNGHVGHDGRGEYHHEHCHLDSRLGLLVAEL
ncbi:hypothetical protein AGLY_003849 [Aphis glycines]|uniref:Uncharacterized protein n=1 Tax=Aphis glycines TaxID=307491 RepID=A0A6G0U0A9_APHGL|nr:hypothetical protein AGLY_003849 [Aphis glycines]